VRHKETLALPSLAHGSGAGRCPRQTHNTVHVPGDRRKIDTDKLESREELRRLPTKRLVF
jgi:hypothetical protein